MRTALKMYIDGKWVEPAATRTIEVINPATEQSAGQVALGSAADVDRAVVAARRAFHSFGRSSRKERIELLEAIIAAYKPRRADVAAAITAEMGAPAELADKLHGAIGHIHLKIALNVLKDFEFSRMRGTTRIEYEPIGVCGLITPWNWPINQIAAKVAPALATGCTMILKPSELSPFSAQIWAEVLDAAGVPAGVFNLVQGDGPGVGRAIAAHPDIDMVSFTGSTRAGIEVARAAAPSIKRVHQELGGKSANIILPDADVAEAAAAGFRAIVTNAGQSCNAPTRMLVPRDRRDEAVAAVAAAAATIAIGNPLDNPDIGPVVSRSQFEKIQGLIEAGVAEGATLVSGGPGRPDGLTSGFYVRPTVFADVENSMTIAREEIFGPVLCVMSYDSVDDAIAIANASEYGLAGYIQGKDETLIADVASRLRVGQVLVNQPHPDGMAPFGGYKQSGNGREWGDFGFEGYLEVKAVLGARPLATPGAVEAAAPAAVLA
ncbi:aldehyde dehydrogenase family protein [Novosphingobium sp. Gsoil 351]|uniref:aldehyde dehydrogenase family protein n=1 Tax=Novosphingobium sp. Gsoil 351 TaxID=2675225 RepID=UPI0012B4ADDD|nr:aldehyde dehydrogenase family protein [Novosphingobium sp. Gsoil 351]QGN54620.1 aldehyde dehydrogenase family protein [Novosphingobium sp. Gsoil 351]